MAPSQSLVGDDVDAFFERCGLTRDTRLRCWTKAQDLFPDGDIQEAAPQGYCSYTLCVGRDTIVQLRPGVHKLDIRLAAAARDIYGSLAPQTKLLSVLDVPTPKSHSPDVFGRRSHHVDEAVVIDDGYSSKPLVSLHVYSMERIPGMSLAQLRASQAQFSLPKTELRQREGIISHFARFIAIGWRCARSPSDPVVLSLRGRVGGSIGWRLQEMRAHLPRRFQPAVQSVLEQLDSVESLPWVLTHGDVVPANVMLRETGNASGDAVMTGLLDWAEAEYLPFGVGIYGVESLLGEHDGDGRFAYYPEAEELRNIFWTRLGAEIPELRINKAFRLRVAAAHALGVLLWHGIAFDNGRLDRVVDEDRLEDVEEVRYLDLFFSNRGRLLKFPGDGMSFLAIWDYIRRPRFGQRFFSR